jgi:hypothetical protein
VKTEFMYRDGNPFPVLCESHLVNGERVPATTHSTNPDWSKLDLCEECAAEYDARPPIDDRRINPEAEVSAIAADLDAIAEEIDTRIDWLGDGRPVRLTELYTWRDRIRAVAAQLAPEKVSGKVSEPPPDHAG